MTSLNHAAHCSSAVNFIDTTVCQIAPHYPLAHTKMALPLHLLMNMRWIRNSLILAFFTISLSPAQAMKKVIQLPKPFSQPTYHEIIFTEELSKEIKRNYQDKFGLIDLY